MSKADQLGAGRFGGGTRPVSARRAAIGAATGVPTEGVAPPTRLPLDRISPNPDNPRTSLGDLTELAGSLREHGQKQAITVMNRDAYVKANPDREEELEPDTTHVVVDGSSRLAAAREAGLTHLNVMVDDDMGADAEAILESALVANVHRAELEPLDEARALQRLLAIHGTQTRLAKRLHKSQGWVSQRLALLNLAPALQERIGEERIELLRAVGNKPAEEQEAALEALKREQSRAEAERAERRKERQAASTGRAPAEPDDAPGSHPLPEGTAQDPQQPDDTAEHGGGTEASGTAAPGRTVTEGGEPRAVSPARLTAVPSEVPSAVPAEAAAAVPAAAGRTAPAAVPRTGDAPASEDSSSAPVVSPAPVASSTRVASAAPAPVDAVPEPRGAEAVDAGGDHAGADAYAPPRLPYDDGFFLAHHLIRKMPDTAFDTMLELLNEHQRQRNAARQNTA